MEKRRVNAYFLVMGESHRTKVGDFTRGIRPSVLRLPVVEGHVATSQFLDVSSSGFTRCRSANDPVVDGRLGSAKQPSDGRLAETPLLEESPELTSTVADSHTMMIMIMMKLSRKIDHAPRRLAKTLGCQDDPEMARKRLVDDREDALGWYLRRRLMEEQDRGVTQHELSKKTGLSQAQISYITTGAQLGTLTAALRLERYFGRTAGQLVDEAVEWWKNKGGRDWALEQETIDHQARRRRLSGTEIDR